MSTNEALEQARGWLTEQGITPPAMPLPGREDLPRAIGTAGSAASLSATPSRSAGDESSGQRSSVPAGGSLGRPRAPERDGDAPNSPDPDPDADPESVARAIVVRKLSARAHTRVELERALQARCVPDEAAGAVLDRMTELGLVDDEGFARDWVQSRQQRRHLSRRGLQQELTRRGVARETIEAALVTVESEDELTAARALVDKKRAALDQLDARVRHRRVAGLLGRRGYSSAVVATVLDETLHRPGD